MQPRKRTCSIVVLEIVFTLVTAFVVGFSLLLLMVDAAKTTSLNLNVVGYFALLYGLLSFMAFLYGDPRRVK